MRSSELDMFASLSRHRGSATHHRIMRVRVSQISYQWSLAARTQDQPHDMGHYPTLVSFVESLAADPPKAAEKWPVPLLIDTSQPVRIEIKSVGLTLATNAAVEGRCVTVADDTCGGSGGRENSSEEVLVHAIAPNTEAHTANRLVVGDVITHVCGIACKGMDPQAVAKLMPTGRLATLHILTPPATSEAADGGGGDELLTSPQSMTSQRVEPHANTAADVAPLRRASPLQASKAVVVTCA
jgi:hypothetical protein